MTDELIDAVERLSRWVGVGIAECHYRDCCAPGLAQQDLDYATTVVQQAKARRVASLISQRAFSTSQTEPASELAYAVRLLMDTNHDSPERRAEKLGIAAKALEAHASATHA